MDKYAERRAAIVVEESLPVWPATDDEFTVLGFMRSKQVQAPRFLKDVSMIDIRRAARSVEGNGGFRAIYALVNENHSAVRIGAGLPDRFHIHVAAYMVNITPDYIEPKRVSKIIKGREVGLRKWKMDDDLYDMIRNNGGRIDYIILADRLSRNQAGKGEQAVIDLIGLDKLVNKRRG